MPDWGKVRRASLIFFFMDGNLVLCTFYYCLCWVCACYPVVCGNRWAKFRNLKITEMDQQKLTNSKSIPKSERPHTKSQLRKATKSSEMLTPRILKWKVICPRLYNFITDHPFQFWSKKIYQMQNVMNFNYARIILSNVVPDSSNPPHPKLKISFQWKSPSNQNYS